MNFKYFLDAYPKRAKHSEAELLLKGSSIDFQESPISVYLPTWLESELETSSPAEDIAKLREESDPARTVKLIDRISAWFILTEELWHTTLDIDHVEYVSENSPLYAEYRPIFTEMLNELTRNENSEVASAAVSALCGETSIPDCAINVSEAPPNQTYSSPAHFENEERLFELCMNAPNVQACDKAWRKLSEIIWETRRSSDLENGHNPRMKMLYEIAYDVENPHSRDAWEMLEKIVAFKGSRIMSDIDKALESPSCPDVWFNKRDFREVCDGTEFLLNASLRAPNRQPDPEVLGAFLMGDALHYGIYRQGHQIEIVPSRLAASSLTSKQRVEAASCTDSVPCLMALVPCMSATEFSEYAKRGMVHCLPPFNWDSYRVKLDDRDGAFNNYSVEKIPIPTPLFEPGQADATMGRIAFSNASDETRIAACNLIRDPETVMHIATTYGIALLIPEQIPFLEEWMKEKIAVTHFDHIMRAEAYKCLKDISFVNENIFFGEEEYVQEEIAKYLKDQMLIARLLHLSENGKRIDQKVRNALMNSMHDENVIHYLLDDLKFYPWGTLVSKLPENEWSKYGYTEPEPSKSAWDDNGYPYMDEFEYMDWLNS